MPRADELQDDPTQEHTGGVAAALSAPSEVTWMVGTLKLYVRAVRVSSSTDRFRGLHDRGRYSGGLYKDAADRPHGNAPS